MANTERTEEMAKDLLKDSLHKYMRNAQKNQLALQSVSDLLESISDDDAKARIISMTTNEENIYHVAVRQNNFDLVRMLNRHLPKKTQDVDSLLIKKKKCSRKRRFRGVLYGRDAQCLTPLHLAVIKWRDEGEDSMFKALMEDDNITARQKLEMLSATDEKGRTVIGIAIDSDADQERKEKMVQDVCEELRKVREMMDDLEVENMKLQDEVDKLKVKQDENMLLAKVEELENSNATMKAASAEMESRIKSQMREEFKQMLAEQHETVSMQSADSGVSAVSVYGSQPVQEEKAYHMSTNEVIKPYNYNCINNFTDH